ncbi:MAG: cell division protein SepF, partial [Candidatus Aenigmarchaeota archaeon]|nr:cell division protein SepF [Candidatus Aenigmarchaeota archaeon]MDW8149049.1 cell division protein SepF [Candidatus Aenigmarchaeota archaeon]
RVETLTSYKDSEKIIEYVRNNKLVLVRITDIKKMNETELKKSVEKMKKFIESVEGEIVGIGDDLLIVAPKIVKILR